MTSHRLHQQLLALTLPVGWFLTPLAADAQSTFTGSTSADWATVSNWIPGVLPAAGDSIAIADVTPNGANTLTLDASHSIGAFFFGSTPAATRITAFTVQTNANVLTLAGGITANGNFAGIGPSIRGNVVIPANQIWKVEGAAGNFGDDRGVAIRGINDNASATASGTLALNGNVTKTGVGAVMLINTDITGAGNLTVDQGVVKLNAGGNQPLIVGGTGNITLNNATSLYVVRNSGTFNITRPFVLNGTSNLVVGNGGGTVLSNAIGFNGTTHTLNVNSPFTFSGPLTSGAATVVNKTSGGVATINGNNSGFLGTLNISGGRVNLDSAFGGKLGLAAGGTLASNAALGGTVTMTGGTLISESAIGGLLTLGGGTFIVDALTPGSLAANGGIVINPATALTFSQLPGVGVNAPLFSYTGAAPNTANFTFSGYRNAVFSDVGNVISLALNNEARTWNASSSTIWEIGGTSTNWTGGDLKFFQGDAVTFGDTGAGFVDITGNLAPSSITINNSLGLDYTFAAAASNLISGSTGITKSGAGTATIGGVNTFTGNIVVNAGILKPSGNQAFGLGPKTVTIAAGAQVDTGGVMNANRDYDAIIAGTGTDGNGVIVNSGGAHNNGFRSLTLAADASIGGLSRWDVRPITAGAAFVNLDNHKLTKIGSNSISIVDGSMTNPGQIEIAAGTLAFTRNVVSGAGAVAVKPGTTLLFENYTAGSFTKDITLEAGLVSEVLTPATLRSAGASWTLGANIGLTGINNFVTVTGSPVPVVTLSGVISGNGGVNKLEAGTLVLSGNNTYTDKTTVNAGQLHIGAGGTSGSLASPTIDLTSIPGPLPEDPPTAAATAVIFNRSDDSTYAGQIIGTGIGVPGTDTNPSAVTKRGAGTLTLSGANTYSGTSRLEGGMIAVGSNSTVFGSGQIDLRGGGIRASDASPRTVTNSINLSSSTTLGSATTGNLLFSGNVSAGGATKILTINNAVTEFSGNIAGSGAGTFFGKAGSGKLILSGSNSYSQITQISAGILQVGNGGDTGSLGTTSVQNNASLVFNLASNGAVAGVISGTGSITNDGEGATYLGGANTYTGNTIINNGSIVAATPFLADTSSVYFAGDGALELPFEGTDTVAKAFLNGNPLPVGVYGSEGSEAQFEVPYIIGTGTLTVTSSGSATPYDDWATANGLTAANNASSANPDFDGYSNLLEFALNSVPLSGVNSGKVVMKVASVGGVNVLTLTLPVRSVITNFTGTTSSLSATGDGVTYTIEASDALGPWTLGVTEVTGTDATAIQADLPVIPPGSGWTYRTFRTPGTVVGDPTEFIRARIE